MPVAVANFDKKLTATTIAAVIHEPFRLSDFVADPGDQGVLLDFINHRVGPGVRDWVREGGRAGRPGRLICSRSRPGPGYSPAPASAAQMPASGAPLGLDRPWWMTSIISGTVVLLMRGRPCLTPAVTS